MIRILHVVTYMGRGGLENMIMNYYRKIDRSKIQFDFLVHRDFQADFDSEIINLGGNIYHMPVLNPFSKSYFAALEEFFSTHHYDIVHSHLDCMSAYPLKIAKKYNVPVRIAHSHNKNQDKDLKYPIKIWSKKKISKYATHLFACGQEAGKWMFNGAKFKILNNAIDAEKYKYNNEIRNEVRNELTLSESDFIVGHVGRFNPQKNHEFIIEIFNLLSKKNSHTKLILVGTGDGEETIKSKVKQYGLDEKVLFLGNRCDVNRVLQAMDVFLFPSIYEGLPLSIVEAQASGLPCVISDNVPIECKVTDLVEVMKLNDDLEKWVQLLISKENQPRTNTLKDIQTSGFDVTENVAQLESFYINALGK